MPRYRAVVLIDLECDSLQQAANNLGGLPVVRDPPTPVAPVRAVEVTKIEKVGA